MIGAEGLVARTSAGVAHDGRLLFAQVREDPLVEVAALRPERDGTLVVVGSGGCTALSLLSAGAERVVAVDSNRSQSHLVELKAVAVAALPSALATEFLGGAPAQTPRQAVFTQLAPHLSGACRVYWTGRPRAIARGALRSGATERFLCAASWIVRTLVHSPRVIGELLSCTSLEAQRHLFAAHWNNRRWRGLFRLLLNRSVITHTYDERLLQKSTVKLSAHFLERLQHGICDLPVATNYFLHQILTGYYRTPTEPAALPLYLGAPPSEETIRRRLSLVDGTMLGYLRTCPDRSVRGFALSNICEWMSDGEVDEMLAEILRVAEDGAVVCVRNFIGWTEIPATRRAWLTEDPSVGAEQLIRGDRSLMQRRVMVLRVKHQAAS